MSSENLVEGYFLITLDNLIFEVKGIIHPNDRVIAYLRYMSEDNGTNSMIKYRKIYDLEKRREYLSSNFSEYLWYSDVHGKIIQSVPREKITSILRPVEHLTHMNAHYEEMMGLQRATIDLVREIIELTKISWSDIGITGSQLLGIATEKSDIDLVIYGEKACLKFYNIISEKYNNISRIRSYSGNALNQHVLFRWKDLIEYHSLLQDIERKKVLQGFFDDFEFFIRLVRYPEEINDYYGKSFYRTIAHCKTSCMITDDSDSIFTPCLYKVESLEYPELYRIVSYRGRFTEQVNSGMKVETRGLLEQVTDTISGESFQQIILGESPMDYLLPI